MSIYSLNNTYLVCDDCQKREEFASVKDARAWADAHGWETVERGGGNVRTFEDHICPLCASQKKWSRAA